MHRFYSNLWKNFCFAALLVFSLGSTQDRGGINYFDESTVAFDWVAEVDTVALLDSVTEQIINKVSNVEGQPLYYYQEVSTNVCFDNKCRPIRLKLYWNITGRYWGFSLGKDEFLSRRDHEPFEAVDYERLHVLLADEFLPFKDVTFEELIEESKVDLEQVDGVTGATSKELSAYVVEGAAYTTYVLWHRIYGSAWDRIRSATENELSSELLLKILQSPSSSDKIWGLNKIDPEIELNRQLEKALLDIILGEEFFTSYRAVDAISGYHLQSTSLQEGLFSIYENADNTLRNVIIEKFKSASEISQPVLVKSLLNAPHLNGVQLGHWLQLYEQHGFTDLKTCQVVAGILDNENRFISNKAYQFLRSLDLEDEEILHALEEYRDGKK